MALTVEQEQVARVEASARHSGSSETGESLAAGCAAGADGARRGKMKNGQNESFFNVSRCTFDASRECRKSPQRQSLTA